MAVEAEWEQPNGSSCSAVFVAERIPHQGRLHYTSWVTVPVPAELSYYSRRPEFGTSIKVRDLSEAAWKHCTPRPRFGTSSRCEFS